MVTPNIPLAVDIIHGITAETLLAALPTQSVDLVVTDPPYDLCQEDKLAIHNEFVRVCRGDILVFSPPENQWAFPDCKYLFWVKPTSTKNYSRSYGRFVEMICVYQRGSTWNTGLNWANYVGVYDDRVVGESRHPHEKPESLIERFVRIHSNQGNLICDPFAGSGTVLRVANRLGRSFIGCDTAIDRGLS